MIQKNRKEAAWIAAAFLLLCIISVYRQLGMRFIPNDPFRPVAVYFVYLLLLAGWWGAIRNRIMQRNMRVFLLAEHSLMLIWVTVRFVQDALLYHDTYLMRTSGYFIGIPLVLIPLLGLYASFGLGKAEEYRISRNWYLLLFPAGILIFLMLTNENHHLIFRLLNGEQHSNLYFHPNTGLFVIIIWAFSLELARIFLIYHKSREMEGDSRYRFVPFLIAVFMVAFSIPYLAFSFVVNIELIEYSVLMFFLEMLVWESCILVGMVPVNTHYEEAFDRSTVAMQIVDEAGRSYLKSACAAELPAELFALLRQQTTVRTAEGQELNIHAIRGGYSIWQTDVSQTIAVIDELEKSAEKLEYDGDLLRQELRIRSDEVTVKEQNHIYNQLTDEIGEQLLLLRNLLGKREWAQDKNALFRQICLIGTYIKRRCNLRLIERSDGQISNKELELCYHELAGCLRQMEVAADVIWDGEKALAPEFAIFTLDMFEFLLEYERFELHSIKVTVETDMTFTVRVHCGSGSRGQTPIEELQRINKENYDMTWQAFANGYQVSVCNGGA